MNWKQLPLAEKREAIETFLNYDKDERRIALSMMARDTTEDGRSYLAAIAPLEPFALPLPRATHKFKYPIQRYQTRYDDLALAHAEQMDDLVRRQRAEIVAHALEWLK